jgi:hypothetical protein
MIKERLFSGIYECTLCDARFDIDDAKAKDLVCDCGGKLIVALDGNASKNE